MGVALKAVMAQVMFPLEMPTLRNLAAAEAAQAHKVVMGMVAIVYLERVEEVEEAEVTQRRDSMAEHGVVMLSAMARLAVW